MTDRPKTTDIVEQLRLWQRINLVGPLSQTASVCNGQVRDMIMLGIEAAAEIERLRAVIRVNALRWNPALSHEQIDEVIHGKRS